LASPAPLRIDQTEPRVRRGVIEEGPYALVRVGDECAQRRLRLEVPLDRRQRTDVTTREAVSRVEVPLGDPDLRRKAAGRMGESAVLDAVDRVRVRREVAYERLRLDRRQRVLGEERGVARDEV